MALKPGDTPRATSPSGTRTAAAAVCLKCGERKESPLAFCPHCGFTPEDLHDQARSILLSDAHRTPFELDAAAADIRRRQILIFESDELQPVLDSLERARALRAASRAKTRRIIRLAIIAGVLAGAATAVIQWFF